MKIYGHHYYMMQVVIKIIDVSFHYSHVMYAETEFRINLMCLI